MKIVIKIGGAALEETGTLQRCVRTIVDLVADGNQVAVVHGGGRALTRTMERFGKESAFVNGLRVTDAEVRDIAVMVLAGSVNKRLVAAIAQGGIPAIGMCGGDGTSFRARRRPFPGNEAGFVGEICSVESRWLKTIWHDGGVPVLSSVALGWDGEYYNVNADQMASACAVACDADALIFLTDVAGVKDGEGAVIPYLSIEKTAALVDNSVISGGMLPKLQACHEALTRGVRRVRIFPAEQAELLSQFYFQKISGGTEILRP